MARHRIDDSRSTGDRLLARGVEVIRAEAQALSDLADALDDDFTRACHSILTCRRQLVVSGMGKSGLVARKIAATFAATGTPAVFVHPGEAAHGDLGMMVPGDLLLVLSNSGATAELRPMLAHARAIGVGIIGVAMRRASLVMDLSDIRLVLPAVAEACAANVAPTTSTTMQMALGDALAMAVMDMRGVTRDDLRALHPGGAIGFRLAHVSEIMHGADRLPLLSPDASIQDVLSVMTSGGFGIAGVGGPDGRLVGVITDGDLRRHFGRLASARALDIMTTAPRTILADMAAEDALLFLNEAKITAAFVLEQGSQRPVGIVHVHDFLRYGLG